MEAIAHAERCRSPWASDRDIDELCEQILLASDDPEEPLEDLHTLPQQVRENVFLDRMISVLSTAFACLATLLAVCPRVGSAKPA